MERIKKIDVAKRQLDTAIIMFFEKKDPIAIHTVACAAYDILRNLVGDKKVKELQTLKDNSLISEKQKKDWYRELNRPQNFFKHAKKDPLETLDFQPQITEFFIGDACNLYRYLTKDFSSAMVVFSTWYFMKNPNFLKSEEKRHLYKKGSQTMDINNYSRFLGLIKSLKF
ncbi:hypothetical protein HOF67_02050 [Candidatus Peregrinibacteria bacterium]|nr:hypothetical protein [Candidatus Peregrinibacteria bacterium]